MTNYVGGMARYSVSVLTVLLNTSQAANHVLICWH